MKIYIFSGSGSGSSTIGKILSKSLNLRYEDIDKILFFDTEIPYTKRRSSLERISLLKEIVSTDDLVLSGWFSDGIDKFTNDFDYVFFITATLENRIERIKLRELGKWGSRVLKNGDMHSNYLEFVKWAKDYETLDENSRSFKMHKLFFDKLTNKKLMVQNDDLEVSVTTILNFIKNNGEQ